MYYNILVPYDGSEHAQNALAAAIGIAGTDKSALITVLNVAEMVLSDDTVFDIAAQMAGVPSLDAKTVREMHESYHSSLRKKVHGRIEEFFERIPENVDIKIEVRSGKPQNVIREFAEKGDYDIIVIGRRGLGAIKGVLGSVSYSVLRAVELPVLIVK